MEQNQKELQDYIREHQQQGFTEEQLRQVLSEHGWQQESINTAFQAVSSANTQSNQALRCTPSSAKRQYVSCPAGPARTCISQLRPLGFKRL